MIHHLKRATKHILILSIIILAVGISSVRILLSGIEDYKTDLESKILELTSIPIKIGKLKANMRGFSPEIILKDLQVLAMDSQNKPTIQLEEIRLGIDLMQLLFTHEVLPSSWLSLVGVKLSIIRKTDGSLSIAGLNAGDSEQPLWLLKGGRYEVLQSEISWLDEQHKTPSVDFKNVDLLIKNEFDRQQHEIHLISQLPQRYGKSLRVSMSLHGNVFDIGNINGMVYIEGKELRLAELSSNGFYNGINITDGNGDLKLWTKWDASSLSSLAGNIHVNDIVLQKENKKTYQISELSTKFNGFSGETGWYLGVKDFLLKTDQQTWPATELSIFAANDFNRFSGLGRQIELLELTELIQFFVPLESEQQDLISTLALKGLLKDFSVYLNTENNQYAINGVFEKFSINAYAGLPQLENITGSINGTHEHGMIAFNTGNGSLFFPELFRKPFPISKLHGLLSWQQTEDSWQIFSERLLFDSKKIQTETSVAVTIPKNDESVFMDLHTSFANEKDISYVPDYYPSLIMDRDVLNWLDNAFVSGKVRQGDALIFGELNDFPFTEGEGVFEVFFNMDEVELNYDSEWPNLKNVSAGVLFIKNGVNIDIVDAEVKQLKINPTKIEIPSFDKSDYVFIKGQVEGSIVDGLMFLQQTPLHTMADNFLDAVKPEGLTLVDLDLKIPLTEQVPVLVNAMAQLNQAALKVKSVDLDISDVSGNLRFTEQGLFSEGIKAISLGYPIDINVGSENFSTAINVKGKTNIFQLNKQFGFFDNQYISDKQIKGSTDYQLSLHLPDNQQQIAELKIDSNLSGVAIELPGSLKKTADQKSPLSVTLFLSDKTLLPLTFNYNDLLNAAININKQENSLHSAHIVYGNQQAIIPIQRGINIQVERDVFDVSEWMKVFNLADNKEKSSENGITKFNLSTSQLLWENENYGRFELAAQRFDTKWQGNLSAVVAKGKFSIPLTRDKDEKIKLDMNYLNLSELKKIKVGKDIVSSDGLSLISVQCDQLWWNDNDLGAVEIETERLVGGIRFKILNITSNNHDIALKVDWIKEGNANVTEVDGTISADDVGVFLSQLGFDNDIKESRGKVEFSGVWPGSPYQFPLAKMDAEMDLEFENGRISSIEPGFGRILGLIAIEQWIKRLTLNFSDIYKEGLSFNSITGHFKISKGKAISKDLRIDSIPAEITISGETNLLNQTLIQEVRVVPKSSGALPIAGTIVGTIAGTITQALASDYKEGYFFGSKYKLTGKWKDVEVTPLHDQDGIFKKTWSGLTDFSWMKPATE